MAITAYNDITVTKIGAIRLLKLYPDRTDNATYTAFENFEKGSFVAIEPITAVDYSTGGEIIVAFKLSAEFIIVQNNYTDMRETLKALSEQSFESAVISCYPLAGQTNPGLFVYNGFTTAGFTVDKFSMTFQINHEAERPKLTIKINRISSIDLLDSAGNFQDYLQA